MSTSVSLLVKRGTREQRGTRPFSVHSFWETFVMGTSAPKTLKYSWVAVAPLWVEGRMELDDALAAGIMYLYSKNTDLKRTIWDYVLKRTLERHQYRNCTIAFILELTVFEGIKILLM